jgi:hypothetical protein
MASLAGGADTYKSLKGLSVTTLVPLHPPVLLQAVSPRPTISEHFLSAPAAHSKHHPCIPPPHSAKHPHLHSPTHSPPHRFFLTFEGADSYLGVWLNGAWVGMSKDSRLPAEWEVTHLVTPGDNLLAALVGGTWGGARGGQQVTLVQVVVVLGPIVCVTGCAD